MSLPPGLLAVHAHPDDEVITTGGVLADAVDRGLRAKVVTCTDGRRGEIVGAGMDPVEVRPRLTQVRAAELAAALSLLGVTEHAFLGYHDSGMMGDEGNDDASSFWQADLHVAIGRLVTQIRDFRPSVVVTYDAFGGYGHPDHIQAHRTTLLAVEAAEMAALYPEAGAPWRIPKVYVTTFPKSVIAGANVMFADAGLPSPFGEATDPAAIPMGMDDDLVTTTIDVTAHIDRKRQALAAHASQVGPDSFFLNVPDVMVQQLFGLEWFARRRTDVRVPEVERDLFAGLV